MFPKDDKEDDEEEEEDEEEEDFFLVSIWMMKLAWRLNHCQSFGGKF